MQRLTGILRLSTLVLLPMFLAWWASTALAAPGKKALDARNVGHIEGVLSRCGQPFPNGLVFTPGYSYMAKTSPGGGFILSYVQPGSYTLKAEFDDSGPITLATDVAVITGEVTGLLSLDFCRDIDGDLYLEDVDCDDTNATIHPGAAEICDMGIDNDCDGSIDEGCLECTDSDFDGFFAQEDCGTPVDCNDSVSWVRPGAPENCDAPQIDANCDGDPLDGCLSCSPGAICDTGSAGVCAVGLYNVSCECVALNNASEEICDGQDNNCNGLVDENGVCDIDCEVSEWSEFSACSASCGEGVKTRTRTVIVPPQANGAACPPLEETVACNIAPCPVDCQVSEFGPWSACSTSCGSGTRTRSRSVLVPPAHGGQACPDLTETESCNTQPCPVDCVMSEWSAWSACSVSCGGGTQTRTRSIIQPSQYGGQACGATLQTQECNAAACPTP
jgi:hypothetical protein